MAAHSAATMIGLIASKAGVAEGVLRLMLGVFAGLPLAFIYRATCYKKNAIIQHILISLCGLFVFFFCFGWSCLHSVVNITLAHFILRFGGPQAGTVILMFAFNMGYLLVAYSFKPDPSEDYTVSWTKAHCILCLRLTGLAWDYYDGNQDQLSEDFKTTAIHDCPSLLQMASHNYFFGGYLVGPLFPMKKYLALIEGNLINKNDDSSNSRVSAGLWRLCVGLLYLAMYATLGPKLKKSFLITDEFNQLSFLYKLCYTIVCIRIIIMKYQAVWLIAEASCIISGLGYNGRAEDGQIRWDGCSNVKLVLFETAYTFQQVIEAFNLTTNKWMFRYLYKRLRFLGSKIMSHFITLVFVALWHGLWPGFFLCFIGEFITIVMEQQLLGLCRRVVQKPFSALPLFVKIPIILFGVCARVTGVSFFLVPFVLLRVDYTHKVWLSLHYIVPLVLFGWFVVYLTILSPLSRSIKTNTTDSNQNKFTKEATKRE